MGGTNTMSEETSSLQQRFRHAVPHSKYTNCRNHKLTFAFVHMLRNKELKLLADVDALFLSLWKMMKYSSVKAAIFKEAQNVLNQRHLKILKAAPTRWLSHGEASKWVITRFGPLVNALDTLYNEKRDTELEGFQDTFLNPDVILMLLLLADTLHHVNRFSIFSQTKNLAYSDISPKF